MRSFIRRDAASRLDFMAALSWSAACLGKRSGVLAGEAVARVAWRSRAAPQVRGHCRGGGVRDKRRQVPGRDRSNVPNERVYKQPARHEELPTLLRTRCPRAKDHQRPHLWGARSGGRREGCADPGWVGGVDWHRRDAPPSIKKAQRLSLSQAARFVGRATVVDRRYRCCVLFPY